VNGIRYSLDFVRDGGGVLLVALALAPAAVGTATAPFWTILTVLVVYAGFVGTAGNVLLAFGLDR